ncbi:MAG: molybdopterin-dependent oxidoreductase, partial [Chitinophagaceae bacterium]|nr:molybdopterin-dependent oxidoreductase [Rubrivivax sp.]
MRSAARPAAARARQPRVAASTPRDALRDRNGGLIRARWPVHNDRITDTEPWDVDLRIDVPLAAHAAIEPRAAVAEFDDQGRLQLWVGSQDVFYPRDVMVKRLALAEEQVVAHGQRVGGAFGGKTLCTVELEAAVLARAARVPVKVQWSRAQEFQLGFHRPPSSHRIRARLRRARHVNADPVQFRLHHIVDDRLRGVLQRVAAVADWTRPLPPAPHKRRGRG